MANRTECHQNSVMGLNPVPKQAHTHTRSPHMIKRQHKCVAQQEGIFKWSRKQAARPLQTSSILILHNVGQLYPEAVSSTRLP